MTLAIATWPTVALTVITFMALVLVLCIADYRRICRREDERQARRQRGEEWDFPTPYRPVSRSVMEREQLPW
jgi:heme exporter protein D